ncbi:MAG: lysoplasmalogenase [Pedobacter sp.]|nr:MAG: lysoplasmalogenase [Pedobacter sp.]
MKKFNPYSILFAIVFIVHLYAEYNQLSALIHITKPLITIVLMAGLVVVTKLQGKFRKRIFAGLVFSFAGDVFLMFQGSAPNMFMYGLASFLICHLIYISAFNLDMRSDTSSKNPYFIWALLLLFGFCAAFFMYLRPSLGALQLPVLLYSIVISLMVVFSVGRYGKVNLYSFRLIALGAFFFLLSDSALAYNKFIIPVPNAGLVIMATYMLAQYMIVYGSITRDLLVKRTEV